MSLLAPRTSMREPLREQLRHDADLDPVREAVRRQARATAASLLADADRRAGALVAEAEAQAARMRELARGRAQAEADVELAQVRRRTRRRGRALELDARRVAYERLVARCHAAVREALGGDERLLAAIAELLRQRCGPGAEVTRLPGGAGVAARLEGREVTCAFDAVADQEVARLLGERAER
jgi:cell division septum initiation protein DivIVA